MDIFKDFLPSGFDVTKSIKDEGGYDDVDLVIQDWLNVVRRTMNKNSRDDKCLT